MTQTWRTERPKSDEHVPYYAGYIAEATGRDTLESLEQQIARVAAVLAPIPEAKGAHRYAEGKWSIKEVIAHVSDAERVFSYRLLSIARADPAPLPGFDQDAWVPTSGADARTLADIGDEFTAIRRATLALLRPIQDEEMLRRGVASGHPVSARAIAWILPGHMEHHMKVLKEKYL